MSTQENNIRRFAFYQAGKCLIQTLLLQHPKTSILKITEPSNNNVLSFSADLSLLERPKSFSHKGKPSSNKKPLYTKGLSIQTTSDLETLLTGLFAGKAGEFFNCHTSQKNFLNQIPLLEYQKVRFSTKKRKNSVRIIEKPNCKQKPNKTLFSFHGPSKQFIGSSQQTGWLTKAPLHKLRLSREQYYSVFAPLGYSVFTNPLSDTKITDFLCQSDMGLVERRKATLLVEFLLTNQSAYTPTVLNLQRNCRAGNLNKTLTSDIKTNYTSFAFAPVTKKTSRFSQQKQISAWCQEKVCQDLMFSKKSYGHWFRIYLPQIETRGRKVLSRDHYFQIPSELEFFRHSLYDKNETQMSALLIRSQKPPLHKPGVYKEGFVKQPVRFCHKLVLTKTSYKNKVLQSIAMYEASGYGMCHNVLVNTFSQALNIIGQNRELLDIVTDHLIRFGRIRLPEILRICSLYVDGDSLTYKKAQR